MHADPNALTQDAAASTPPIKLAASPVQIDPYRVLELLGLGGMGRVYLAESELPKRKVAIKLMLGADVHGESFARFRQEMEVLAQLDHPGIARLYEVGELSDASQTQPWYAMEYVAGLPLDEYVKRHRLSIGQIFTLVGKIARAIHFAHQRGIIHRDLKPANILVDQEGQPKLLDFGIARLNRSESDAHVKTRMGQILGTLAYMSPEQFSSSNLLDVRADVYALGVILYELLSGELPVKLSTDSLLEVIRELTESKRKPISAHHKSLPGKSS
ncbi:serine/threonine protein kinase [bacterium]|nr:serine/threonine protein kinase [bacterium]